MAILSGGRLQTCGSPLFLKSRFGTGFSLCVVRQQQHLQPTAPSSSSSVAALTSLIRRHVPEADLFSQAAAELLYRLPLSAASALPDLLRALGTAEARAGMGVASFGLSMTTLEEVFLKIARDGVGSSTDASSASSGLLGLSTTAALGASLHSPLHRDGPTAPTDVVLDMTTTSHGHDTSGKHADTTTSTAPVAAADELSAALDCRPEAGEDPSCPPLSEPSAGDPPGKAVVAGDDSQAEQWQRRLWEQLRQLLWKRALVARRDLKGLCFQVLLPALLIALVLLLLTIKPRLAGPSIPMDLGLYRRYGPIETPYSSPLGPGSDRLQLLQQQQSSPSASSAASGGLQRYRYLSSGDSYNTSELLLQSMHGGGGPSAAATAPRLGSIVTDDQVLLNITVDYPTIKRAQPQAEVLALLAAQSGMVAGLSSPSFGVLAYEGPVSLPFSTQDQDSRVSEPPPQHGLLMAPSALKLTLYLGVLLAAVFAVLGGGGLVWGQQQQPERRGFGGSGQQPAERPADDAQPHR